MYFSVTKSFLPAVRDSRRKTRDSPLQSSVDVVHVEKGGNRNGKFNF